MDVPSLLIQLTSPRLVVGTWGPVFISSWRQAIVAEDVDEAVRFANELWRRHPRYSSVSIVGPDIGIPSVDTRDVMRKTILETKDRELLSVLVFDGPAVWATAMRTMFASLFFLSRSARSDRFVAKLEEAAMLAHGYTSAPQTPSDLFKALSELRSLHVSGRSPPPG